MHSVELVSTVYANANLELNSEPSIEPKHTTVLLRYVISNLPVCYYAYLNLRSGHGMESNGTRFFHIPYWQFSSIPFQFHTKNLPFHIKNFFHIPFHIFPYQRNFKLEAMQRIFCGFAPLQCCKQLLVKYANNTKMRISGMHIAQGLMHWRSLRGLNRKSRAMRSSEVFEKRDFLWDKK